EMGSNVDPDAILASRNHFIDAIAARYADDFAKLYDALKQDGAFSPDADAAGKRALRNALLDYLSRHEKSQQRAADQFALADNMTDRFAALTVLVHRFGDTREA